MDQQEVLVERFLRYVKIDTRSDDESETHPSTAKQRDLAKLLASELEELGLAVDINSISGEQEFDIYRWLADNAHRYGFILRYPEGKEAITGIAYEPWHYRYVGKAAAEEIYDTGLTLEEYLVP